MYKRTVISIALLQKIALLGTACRPGFRLPMRFVETGLRGEGKNWRWRKIRPKTEQVRKNVKVKEGTGF